MKNQLLWCLFRGETPLQEPKPEENILAQICMGGFCAAVFSLRENAAAQEIPADKLEEAAMQVSARCSEERCKCVSVVQEGRVHALISYQTRRDSDVQPAARIAQRMHDMLEQALDVPVDFGVGGYCQFYEMIPFSHREACADLEGRRASRTIRNIISFVEENYADPELSNGVIARASFLNYSYMCTQFHGEVGVTLNQFIRMFRMRRALRNLEEPGLSIQAAALKAGYDDCKYFSKCFKREFGMTPGRYQRRAAENT